MQKFSTRAWESYDMDLYKSPKDVLSTGVCGKWVKQGSFPLQAKIRNNQQMRYIKFYLGEFIMKKSAHISHQSNLNAGPIYLAATL